MVERGKLLTRLSFSYNTEAGDAHLRCISSSHKREVLFNFLFILFVLFIYYLFSYFLFISLSFFSSYHELPEWPCPSPTAARMVGETGPITASLAINMTIAGFFAVACYNCVEILISLLDRFKRRDGLYFWSMLTATLGIVLHSIVVLLRYYSLGPNFPLAVLTCVGWYAMVTG